jgi:hypothetical protein
MNSRSSENDRLTPDLQFKRRARRHFQSNDAGMIHPEIKDFVSPATYPRRYFLSRTEEHFYQCITFSENAAID